MLFKQWCKVRIPGLPKTTKGKSFKLFKIFFKPKRQNFICDIRKILSKFRFGQYFSSFLHYDVQNICLFIYFYSTSILLTSFGVGLVPNRWQQIILNNMKNVPNRWQQLVPNRWQQIILNNMPTACDAYHDTY